MNPLNLTHSVPLILLFAIAAAFTSGCDESEDHGFNPAPQSGNLIAIAGDATLQVYDPFGETWLEPAGLGLGANDTWTDYEFELYVLNSTSHTLQRFEQDNTGVHITGTLDLGLEDNTSPFALTGSGDRLYVSNLLDNSVSVIDRPAMQITDTWRVGRAPEGVHSFWNSSLDQYELYVLNSGYDFSDFSFHTGSIYQLDPDSGTVLDSLALGTNPQYLIDRYSGELHVVCTGNYRDIEGKIWVLDTNPLAVKQIIEIGHTPGRITVDTDNNVAILAAGGWSNEGDTQGLILRYDLDSHEILEPLAASLGVVDVLWFNADDRLYAICRDAMKLDVFEEGERIESIDLEDPPNCISAAFLETWIYGE